MLRFYATAHILTSLGVATTGLTTDGKAAIGGYKVPVNN